jgi:hypothetical protein
VVWKAAKDELDMLEFDVKHVPATGQQCLFESSDVITEETPYAVTFLKAGTYDFECTVYGMQGTVVVASNKAMTPNYLLAKTEPDKPTVFDLYGRWQQWMEVYVSETEDLTGCLAAEAFDRNAQLRRPVWLRTCLSCAAELPVEGTSLRVPTPFVYPLRVPPARKLTFDRGATAATGATSNGRSLNRAYCIVRIKHPGLRSANAHLY